MRIQFDHQAFLEQRYGGVSRYFWEVASRLSALPGMSVRISAGLHVNEYLKPKSGSVFGFKVPVVQNTVRIRSYLNHRFDDLTASAWRPDVVHETYYSRRKKERSARPTVLTIHDLIHERYPEFFPGDPTVTRRRTAMERATALVCVSESTKSHLIDIYPQYAKKVVVIPHGENFKQPTPSACSVVTEATGNQPFLLFVGDRRAYKNFDRFVSAFKKVCIHRHDLRILCFGGGHFGGQELEVLRSTGLPSDRFVQLGGSDDVLNAAYRLAEVFVYPSLEEGFGIPLLEASAAGCPVVCSHIPVFTEVLGSEAKYFDPSSIESMALAIEQACSNRKDEADFVLKSKITSIYNWNASAESHARLYRSLL